MYNAVFAGSLFIYSIIASNGFTVDRIVGGTTAQDGAYPHQISMRVGNSHFCGGSIISETCILTAAHCLVGQSVKDMTIVAGTNYLNSSGEQYFPQAIHFNKNFSYSRLDNDVGVVVLKQNIVFNKKVQPIKISKRNIIGVYETATLSGWGRLKLGGQVPNALQQLNVTVLKRESCQLIGFNITESHICAFSREGQGACHGDSGGPLIFDGEQIGIVSFGRPCAQGFPDVYTRVSTFIDWIKSHCSQM